MSGQGAVDRYGAVDEGEYDNADAIEESRYSVAPQERRQNGLDDGPGRDDNHTDYYAAEDDEDDDEEEDEEEEEDYKMTIQELIYSSSSYYAIAKPVTLTMVLAALAVVVINNEETLAEGEAAMSSAYQVWSVDSNSSNTVNLGHALANAFIMVSVICCMTFVVVFLYRCKFIKCLIGYMILCSATLLGILGGNLLSVAVRIYNIPVDKLSFALFIYNFCIVGVISVFFGQGIPKYITQIYLILTSVILAWHLSYFDVWTCWTLLVMLALYDLCAVLTPCGPLKALVEAMSQEDSPEMPGLLFEADLPPEAKRPGVPPAAGGARQGSAQQDQEPGSANPTPRSSAPTEGQEGEPGQPEEGPTVTIPLAIAKVYQLPIIELPPESTRIMRINRHGNSVSSSPLLDDEIYLPEDPNPKQLRAIVVARLPATGGRIEEVARRGKKVYLERDRHGSPKRILWVDRQGKVFAEMRGDDEEGPDRNSIRLGLGDFIFYSVLVAKAAQYSFSTFAACTLVILSGLGGTLVLLSVYHHALPALPISIFLGVISYLLVRYLVQPWIEAVLSRPYYV